MTSPRDNATTPPPKPPAEVPPLPPRRKLVRFDFPPGTSLSEIVRAVHEMTQRNVKPKP